MAGLVRLREGEAAPQRREPGRHGSSPGACRRSVPRRRSDSRSRLPPSHPLVKETACDLEMSDVGYPPGSQRPREHPRRAHAPVPIHNAGWLHSSCRLVCPGADPRAGSRSSTWGRCWELVVDHSDHSSCGCRSLVLRHAQKAALSKRPAPPGSGRSEPFNQTGCGPGRNSRATTSLGGGRLPTPALPRKGGGS